jgi:hypothetical protein
MIPIPIAPLMQPLRAFRERFHQSSSPGPPLSNLCTQVSSSLPVTFPCLSSYNREQQLTISFWTLPEICIAHITKVRRKTIPIARPVLSRIGNALYPYLLIEFVNLLQLADLGGTGTARRIFFADSDIDEIIRVEAIALHEL